MITSAQIRIFWCACRSDETAVLVRERAVKEFAIDQGQFDVGLVDLAAFDLPLLDEATPPFCNSTNVSTKRWSMSVDSADTYIFATPEYDDFPPASLVNAVQVVMREWACKPAGIVSYGGISGGLRASQALRQLITSVNVPALPHVVPVPSFGQFIRDDGVFRPNERTAEGATGMLDELQKWAVALRTMRS